MSVISGLSNGTDKTPQSTGSDTLETIFAMLRQQQSQIQQLTNRLTCLIPAEFEKELTEKDKTIEQLFNQIIELKSNTACLEIPAAELVHKTRLQVSAPIFKAQYKGAWVAVKEYYLTDDDQKVFLKEFQVLRTMVHPNIVSIRGRTAESLGIVMEYMDLGSLFELLHIKKTPLSVQLKLAIMKEAACGLQYLHVHNIIHGDIKSANVLINSSWMVKLCDFGVSKVPGYTTTSRKSFQYAPPESFVDTTPITPQSDVYSFGIVLWEILSVMKPYDGIDKDGVIMQQIINQIKPRFTKN